MTIVPHGRRREPPLIFLDTSVLKHSADRLIRGI
jgi:hypothetical protein